LSEGFDFSGKFYDVKEQVSRKLIEVMAEMAPVGQVRTGGRMLPSRANSL
jgi:hypothetical protein